jgi:hypothetical protein
LVILNGIEVYADGMFESGLLGRKLNRSRHFEEVWQMSHPAVILLVRFNSTLVKEASVENKERYGMK